MAGRSESFEDFRELISLLLRLTILAPHGGVRLASGPRLGTRVLGGLGGPDDPVPLNDGRYLRISVTLFLASTPAGHRLKVEKAVYQYQMDQEGEQWIFRYDYLRRPPEPHPSAHLQIRGSLFEDCLLERMPLERIHFPTMRVSFESVIRLLTDGFGVQCHESPEIWRPVLAQSEHLFHEIAHPPLPESEG